VWPLHNGSRPPLLIFRDQPDLMPVHALKPRNSRAHCRRLRTRSVLRVCSLPACLWSLALRLGGDVPELASEQVAVERGRLTATCSRMSGPRSWHRLAPVCSAGFGRPSRLPGSGLTGPR